MERRGGRRGGGAMSSFLRWAAQGIAAAAGLTSSSSSHPSFSASASPSPFLSTTERSATSTSPPSASMAVVGHEQDVALAFPGSDSSGFDIGLMIAALSIALALPLGGAFFARRIRSASLRNWLRALKKPPLRMSRKHTKIAQTVAYCGIGCSSFLVWRAGGISRNSLAIVLYLGSMSLDLMWGPIFYGWRGLATGLADKVLALALTSACLPLFYKASGPAAALALPYVAWQAYGCYFNGYVWFHNHGAKRVSRWNVISPESL